MLRNLSILQKGGVEKNAIYWRQNNVFRPWWVVNTAHSLCCTCSLTLALYYKMEIFLQLIYYIFIRHTSHLRPLLLVSEIAGRLKGCPSPSNCMRWPGTVSPHSEKPSSTAVNKMSVDGLVHLKHFFCCCHHCHPLTLARNQEQVAQNGRTPWDVSLFVFRTLTHTWGAFTCTHACSTEAWGALDVRRDQRPGLVWAGASGSARSRGLQSDTSGCLCRCRPWETAQAPEISGPEGDVMGQDVFPAARLSHACWTCSETCWGNSQHPLASPSRGC